jgi:phage major head subunit gpT-like protein
MSKQSNTGDLDTAIYDGEQAFALLKNPAVLKALETLEAKAASEMVDALDPVVREQKWYFTRAIRELKKQLLVTQNAGAAAKETKAKRARNV